MSTVVFIKHLILKFPLKSATANSLEKQSSYLFLPPSFFVQQLIYLFLCMLLFIIIIIIAFTIIVIIIIIIITFIQVWNRLKIIST